METAPVRHQWRARGRSRFHRSCRTFRGCPLLRAAQRRPPAVAERRTASDHPGMFSTHPGWILSGSFSLSGFAAWIFFHCISSPYIAFEIFFIVSPDFTV